MTSPRLTWLGDLLGRFGIVALFTMAALAKCGAIYKSADEWAASSPDFELLRLLSEVANLAFLLLIVATTIVRLKPLRSAQGLAPRLTALGGTFAMVFLVLTPPTVALSPTLNVFALCLTLVGFSLSVYVLYWLGRSFSIMAEARRLVTAGPYSIVRHPLYCVEEIAIIGVLLLHLSFLGMLIVALQWALQMRRMHNEELVLAEAFCNYGEYAARTPKFIPRLPVWPAQRSA
jgi:protein-S-isoprenylcysteine O-methyltransferase Ste14